jgi:3-oxoacyl-[acyl-carrier protein] reductase
MKTAIITGASRGIGKAIALRLSQDGFSIVVNYTQQKDQAEKVVQQIMHNGGQAIALQADVSLYPPVERLFKTTLETFGSIDVLVNNAGVSSIKPLAESDDALFDRLFNVNVKGTVHTFRQAALHLRDQGRIINLSSTAVLTATPGLGLYISAKAAVEALTKNFAKELRGRHITVNTIAPGLVRSEMFFEGKTEEQINTMAKLSPLERLGEVEEIANVVAFLASAEASWINGQVIRVNGGTA